MALRRAKGTSRLKSKCTKLSDLLIGGAGITSGKLLARLPRFFAMPKLCFTIADNYGITQQGLIFNFVLAAVKCGNSASPLSLRATQSRRTTNVFHTHQ